MNVNEGQWTYHGMYGVDRCSTVKIKNKARYENLQATVTGCFSGRWCHFITLLQMIAAAMTTTVYMKLLCNYIGCVSCVYNYLSVVVLLNLS